MQISNLRFTGRKPMFPELRGLKQIAKGSFTDVFYLNEDEVMLRTTDKIKELYAQNWLPELDWNPYPVTEYLDCSDNGDFFLLKMKRYDRFSRVEQLNEKSKKLLKAMKCFRVAIEESQRAVRWTSDLSKAVCEIPEEFREFTQESIDSVCNYSNSAFFEISPRNLAVDGSDLILLDCWFSRSEFKRIR